MKIFRTRFVKDIVAEVAQPAQASAKVVIICSGVPGYPEKEELLTLFARHGYWAICPRYRGSWESDGSFLHLEPTQDILDVLAELPRGFVDLFNGKRHSIRSKRAVLFGSSFGGPAVLLASRNPRVEKVVALSAVVDWQAPSADEPLDVWVPFTQRAFGQGYRVQGNAWKKLLNGRFYNPVSAVNRIDGAKAFMIHAKDDRVVDYATTAKFATRIGARLLTLARGGHGSSKFFLERPAVQKAVWKFLR